MEDLKEKIFTILHPEKIDGVFAEQDIVSDDIVTYIRKLSYVKARVSKLFKEGASFGKRQQNIEIKCDICGKRWVDTMGTKEVCDYINNRKSILCHDCKQVALHEEETKRKKNNEEWEKTKQQKTADYIDNFLDPTKSWKNNVKNWIKIRDLSNGPVDYETIATHILSMNYRDFLKTPYWVAIAEKVKLKNGFCCELCGCETKELNVHHPGYEFHGYELQNIPKLKCLCQNCHKKFHNIGGQNELD